MLTIAEDVAWSQLCSRIPSVIPYDFTVSALLLSTASGWVLISSTSESYSDGFLSNGSPPMWV